MNIFTIKIIALILMLMDHIGEFFPDSPIWFRWLGRLAAPLFFYALAVGFQHTRNRKKYLLRLYLANVGMVFFNQIMCMLQRKLDYVAYQPKNHNIFTTLFCAGVLICIWENRKEKKKFFTYIGIYIFWQAMVMGLAILAEAFDYVWRCCKQSYGQIIFSRYWVESGMRKAACSLLCWEYGCIVQ